MGPAARSRSRSEPRDSSRSEPRDSSGCAAARSRPSSEPGDADARSRWSSDRGARSRWRSDGRRGQPCATSSVPSRPCRDNSCSSVRLTNGPQTERLAAGHGEKAKVVGRATLGISCGVRITQTPATDGGLRRAHVSSCIPRRRAQLNGKSRTCSIT